MCPGTCLAGILCAALLYAATSALAEPDTYSVQWENDRIANTDRHYTKGFRLSWVSGARDDDPA